VGQHFPEAAALPCMSFDEAWTDPAGRPLVWC